MSKLTIHAGETLGTISPYIHGHFAEHLGRCCYDGLWVGPDSPIPNQGGFRTDVIEALKSRRHPPIALAWRLLRRLVPLARRHRAERGSPPDVGRKLRPERRGRQHAGDARVY